MSEIKLYEINKILNDSMEMLDCIEDEEEKKQGIEEINNQIKEMIVSKSNNLLAQYRYYDTNIDTIEKEIKRLQELKKKVQKQQESFINYVDYNFGILGVDEVETAFGKIKYRKQPLSIEVNEEDIDKLPKEYLKVKTEVSVDKTAIKDLYKTQGIKLPNVTYNEDKYKLSFN